MTRPGRCDDGARDRRRRAGPGSHVRGLVFHRRGPPDPPYAPPRDDNCYIKRYHFLEGLSTYWRGQQIMPQTRTKKLAKRYTPFSYGRTVTDALRRTLAQFRGSVLVLSYSSNAVPDVATIETLLHEVKNDVQIRPVEHTYSFGTHATARRRTAREYLFIAR